MALSDRIAVMHLGRLQQVGTPREVYLRPANRVVADFMGLVNLVPARVLEPPDPQGDGLVGIGSSLHFRAGLPPGASAGGEGLLAVRPESVHLARGAASDPA